jgi:hypothetical protein
MYQICRKHPQKPLFIDSKVAPASGRAPTWRVVAAGTPISAHNYHCMTVPDGPDGRWEGGDYERLEKRNRAALQAVAQQHQPSI